MTLKHSVLTLAISLALAGCASDNMAWNANQSTDTSGISNSSNKQNFAALPDNPQVAANDKTRVLGSISDADYKFIRETEGGNLYEISAGQKVQIKSNDAELKSLAQHIVDDHAKAEKQLLGLASRGGVPTEAGMSAAQIDMLKRLDDANGADFDREYLSQQQSAHQETISKFENAAANADDKDLRDWASATLPTLRGHLEMVKNHSAGTSISPPAGSGSTPGNYPTVPNSNPPTPAPNNNPNNPGMNQ